MAAALILSGLSGCVTITSERTPVPGPEGVRRNLPLVLAPPAQPDGDAFIVWYSGVGGWGRADRAITPLLAARNLPVVGVDSLAYFWGRQTPETAAADLDALIRGYGERWHRTRVVLLGYSFGGAALPLIVARLPPETRARISLLVLLAPSPMGELTLRPRTLLDIPSRDATRLPDEMRALGPMRTLCIFDPADRKSACPQLPGVAQARVWGGHLFKGADEAVTKAIVDGAIASGAEGAPAQG